MYTCIQLLRLETWGCWYERMWIRGGDPLSHQRYIVGPGSPILTRSRAAMLNKCAAWRCFPRWSKVSELRHWTFSVAARSRVRRSGCARFGRRSNRDRRATIELTRSIIIIYVYTLLLSFLYSVNKHLKTIICELFPSITLRHWTIWTAVWSRGKEAFALKRDCLFRLADLGTAHREMRFPMTRFSS